MGVHALGYLALDAVEGSAADEQDVVRVYVDILLVGMLAAALGRHVDNGSLQQFQQSLLHALAADVAGDRGVVGLAGYLVYLVDEDDASLGSLHVVVGHLQQSGQDALHVLADIAGLGEHGGIDDGEGHVQQLGDGAGQQRLARSRRAHHDDVRLLYLHAVVVVGLLQSLVVVIDRHGEVALGLVLPDDILVQIVLDVLGLGHPSSGQAT